MLELTRIYTVEITCVEKMSDEEYQDIKKGEDAEKQFAQYIKYATKADDVQVKVQDFIMEKGE
jgi:hypothetical protein